MQIRDKHTQTRHWTEASGQLTSAAAKIQGKVTCTHAKKGWMGHYGHSRKKKGQAYNRSIDYPAVVTEDAVSGLQWLDWQRLCVCVLDYTYGCNTVTWIKYRGIFRFALPQETLFRMILFVWDITLYLWICGHRFCEGSKKALLSFDTLANTHPRTQGHATKNLTWWALQQPDSRLFSQNAFVKTAPSYVGSF
jgi:hypothetical protein